MSSYPGKAYEAADVYPGDLIEWCNNEYVVLDPRDPAYLDFCLRIGSRPDPDTWIAIKSYADGESIEGVEPRHVRLTHRQGEAVQPPDRSTGLQSCPICGSPGDDIVFAFCCSRAGCQNYRPTPEFGGNDIPF